MNYRPLRKALLWQLYSGLMLTLAGVVTPAFAQENVAAPATIGNASPRNQTIDGETIAATRQATMDFGALVQTEKAKTATPFKKSKPPSQSLQEYRKTVVPSGAPVGKQKFQAKSSSSLSSAIIPSGNSGAIAKAGTALPPSPSPSASFQALLGPTNSSVNPDTQGAVGPNHLVTTLNTSVLVQDRNGGTVSSISIEAFWASVGASNIFDPRIVYEPYGQRWITTAEADPGGRNPGLLVGVSKTSNPTQGWNLYFIDLDTDAPRYADSPNLGFNKDFIVVQANIYNGTNSAFVSSDVYVFNRTNLYAGGPGTSTRFSSVYDSQVPATIYDPDFPEVYLAYNYAGNVPETDVDTGLISNYGELYLWSIKFTNGVLGMTFESIVYSCEECTWADYVPITQTNFAPQLGSSTKVYGGDSRIQNLVYRDGTFYTTHTVFLPTNNPTVSLVQWWQFTPADPVTGSQTLTQDRVSDSTGGFFAFPSIAVNQYNQYLIGYTRFSATTYPSANYTYVTSDDFAHADTVLKAGEGPYRKLDSGGFNLWGDWSATVVDPVNDTDFWTLQEYSARNGSITNIWGTWWGRISPPTEVSIALTDSPDPVLAGGNIIYTISLTNAGVLASGVTVSDPVPPGAVFVSGSTSQGGGCTLSNTTVICDFGTLDTVASGTIILSPKNSGTFTNRVTVSANGTDGDLTDNTATATTVVNPAADLALSMSDFPDPVNVSNNLTYTLVVTNFGPSAAASVVFTNTLPANATFVSVTTSIGTCSPSGGLVLCNLGTVAAGASPTIRITVNPKNAGSLTNSARVASTTPDPTSANNLASLATRVNALPAISALPARTILEDASTGPISFTVSDLETPASSLVLSALSSNPALVPVSNIIFGGTSGNRTVTVTPLPTSFGSATIGIVATDADNASTTNSFVLTVSPVNDPPTLDPLNNLTINEDGGIQTIPLTGISSGAANENQILVITATSGNMSVIPNPTVSYTSPGVSGSLSFTPVANGFGTAIITVTVNDGGTSNNIITRAFTVTVNPVNDPPTLNAISDLTVNEDAGLQTLNLAGISAGAPNEGQTVSITATSSAPALIPNPTVNYTSPNSTGTLTFLPVTNASGIATITVTVNDGGASNNVISRTFNVTVNPVNDLPTLDTLANLTLIEDAPAQTVNLTGISSGADNESQTLTVTAVSSNPSLIPTPTVSYTSPAQTGSLTLTPAANAFGTANITVTVNDGGASNNIVTRTFTVTVNAVNDVPNLDPLNNLVVNEDSAAQVVSLTGINSGAANESQSLSVTAVSSDPSVIPNPVVTYTSPNATGTLTLTPAANAFGTSTISVSVNDGGASNNVVTRTFAVTVVPVNDAPTLNAIANLTIAEDSGPQTISLAGIGSGATNESQTLTITATSSNPTLIPSPNVTYASPGATGALTITPSADAFGTATVTVIVNDGGTSNNVVTRTFNVTVNPVNDLPTLDAISNISIAEDTGIQTIALTGISSGAPNETQTLSVTASTGTPNLVTNLAIVYASPASSGTLTFRPVPNAFGTATITVNVNDGGISNNVVSRSFNVVITPVNDLPFISNVQDQVTDEDVPKTVSFVINDSETAASNLVVTTESSNPEVVLSSGLRITGTGTNRTLVITPITNAFGSATITLTVKDTDGGAATVSFEFLVNSVNDAPAISAIPSQSINEDGVLGPLAFTVDDPDIDNILDDALVTASSSNQSLVPASNIVLGGSGSFRTITIQPVTNQSGTAVITLTATDGTTNSVRSFTLTVTPVNDTPTLSVLPDLVLDEGALQQTVSLSGITSGATNEIQVLSVTATSSNPSLIPTPAITYTNPATTGVLRFTPATDASGTVVITVSVNDGGTSNNIISRSFNVVLNAINDPPTLSPIPDLTINENSGPQSVVLSNITAGAGNELDTLRFSAVSSNPGLIQNLTIVYTGPNTTGVLSFAAAPNSTGSSLITVTLNDGGTSNNIITRSFQVTVRDINDPPTINQISNLTINEDSGFQAVQLGGISSGAPNEVQTLALTASVTPPGLLTNLQVVYSSPASNGVLSFGTVSNAYGVATISVNVNDGGASNNITTRTFTVNVVSVNDLPFISSLTDRFVNEDVSTGPGAFTVGDVETPAASLTLTASSSNPVLVPAGNITFGGSGNNRTVSVLPATNQSGVATITIKVQDADGGSATSSFVLGVAPINDPPTILPISNQIISEDAVAGPLALAIGDVETPANSLIVTASSANQALIGNSNILLGGTGSNRTITLTPYTNQSGSSLISITVRDAEGSAATTSFNLTVNAVNDPPTISAVPPLTFNEGTPFSVPFTVDDVETVSSSLVVSAVSSNQTLVPNLSLVLGGTGANRMLTITPAAGQSGTSLITLTVSDGNATGTRSFLVTVLPVNDPPNLDAVANVTMSEDATLSVNLTGISAGPGESQSLSITANSSNPSLLPNPVISYTSPAVTGSLVLSPLPNATGTAVVTVTVDDGAASNNIVTRNFTVTVNALNDPPTISSIANQTVNEDTSATVAFVVGDPETAAVSLNVTAASSNPTLVPNSSIIISGSGSNRTVSITPVTNQNGSSTITLTVSDGALTATTSFLLTVVALNDSPTLNPLNDLDQVSGNWTRSVPFNGISSGAPNESQTLTVTAVSANTAVVLVNSVAYTSPATNGTISLGRFSNQAVGSSLITVTVSDGVSTFSRSFTIYVHSSVNAAPTISGSNLVARTIAAGSSTPAISFGVADDTTTPASLSVYGRSSNPALVPDSNIIFGGAGSNRTVTVTPAAHLAGTANISIFVNDGNFGLGTTNFSLTVTQVNELPVISSFVPQSIAEDTVLGPIAFTVTDQETAPGNLNVSVSSSNLSLVPLAGIVLGGSGTNRALLLTPAPNQSGTSLITLLVSDGNGGSASNSFLLTVTPVNDPPTISTLGTQTLLEDTSSPALAFTVGDIDTAATSLQVSAFSSNPALLPLSGILLGGSGSNRTVTLLPAAEQNGSATVTLFVNDGAGGTNATSFTVVVNPVNDLPTLDPIGNVTLNQGSPGQVVNLSGISAGPPNEASQQVLAISAVSSNPTLVANPLVSYTSPGSTASLVVAPQPGQFGSALITVTVNDGQSANNLVSRSFSVSVNGAPVISSIADQSVNENGTIGPVGFTVGDPESAAASLVVSAAASSNPSLVPLSAILLGGSGSNRTVTITPTSNLNGFSLVTLNVSDANGNTNSRSFGVVVNAVNNGPSLDPIGNLTLNEDSGAQAINLSGISSGGPTPTVVVSASTTNPGLLGNLSVNYTNPAGTGTLTFTPVPNAYGTGNVTVVVDNGGATNGTLSRTFSVVVNSINDAPTLDLIPDLELAAASGQKTVTLSGISAGPNETQTLNLTATSDNPSVVPSPGIVYANPDTTATLTLTPPGKGGVANITVTVQDNGGTANGGQSTMSRTFKVTVTGAIPTLDPIGNMTVNEDSGPQLVNLSGISSGGPNPAVVVSANTTNAALIGNLSVSYTNPAGTGKLTFTPVPNAYGTGNITVVVDNGAGTNGILSRTFQVVVSPINDQPTLDLIADVELAAASGQRTITLSGLSAGPNETQTLNLTATSDNPSVVANPSIAYTNPDTTATLTLAPAGKSGVANITVTVQDNGDNANGGQGTLTRTFKVTVTGGEMRLRIAQAGVGKILVAWPTNAIGLVLQSRDDLKTAAWADVSVPPVIIGSEFVITNSAASGSRFYRLGPPGLGGKPQLRIFAAAPGFITVAWSTNLTGYDLQSTTNLSPAIWAAQPGTVTLKGAEYQVTLQAIGNKYFRLAKGGTTNGGTPQLRIFKATPGFITVAWSTNFSGFDLQSATSLSPANWTSQPGTVAIVGTEYRLTLPATGNKYFRLAKAGTSSGGTAQLKISSRSPGSVVLSWPATSTGFLLQSTTSLTSPHWTSQPEAVSLSGGEYSVTVSATGSKFFRLVQDASFAPTVSGSGQAAAAKSVRVSWPYGSGTSLLGK